MRWLGSRFFHARGGITNRVQVGLDASKGDGEEVSSGTDTADVKRLCHVHGEMGDELDGVGARRVLAVPDLADLGVANAALEDLGLVGDGADDASFQGIVAVRVDITVGWRVVGRVDVMPCVGIFALVGLAVVVCPSTDATQTALILRLE